MCREVYIGNHRDGSGADQLLFTSVQSCASTCFTHHSTPSYIFNTPFCSIPLNRGKQHHASSPCKPPFKHTNMPELRFITMNCRGLATPAKRRDVVDYLKHSPYDIIFLQDTHLTRHSIPYFDLLWKGKCYHACQSSFSRGTSILIRHTVSHEVLSELEGDNGNFKAIRCSIQGNMYLFISVYGPNEDNPEFYNQLESCIESLNSENIVIAGDWNFVLDLQKDCNYIRENNKNAKIRFLETIEKYNLLDTWRELHPDGKEFTWFRQNPLKYGRLDMVFINSELKSNITKCDIVPSYRTDHHSVTWSIREQNLERGPGIWKFNESLLNDVDYVESIKCCIVEQIEQYAIPLYTLDYLSNPSHYADIEFRIDINLFYETLLMMIRGETVKFSKRKARRNREQESKIINDIETLQKQIASGSHEKNEELLRAKDRLEELRAPKIQGLITRSRVAWYEEGEKSTKYFLSLEKRNVIRKSINCIKKSDRLISNKKEILSEFTAHFSRKYSSSGALVEPSDFLKQTIDSKLSEEQKIHMDKPISLTELTTALNAMKKGRSPGINGFTAPFFKTFWEHLGPFLLKVLNNSIACGKLCNSFREGIITLIPKSGQDQESIKGWRPISLLNADFKIISSVIANRLKSVMDSLIAPTQSAYIKGRYIGENTRLVYDIIDYLNEEKKSGLILAADFEAAFESVSWSFLKQALISYNFGPQFRSLVELLYFNSDNFARIIVNGYLGDKIFLCQGIRQGDPASGYFFNLAAEPLATLLKKSNQIIGVPLRTGMEVRVSQYADDLIAFLKPDNKVLNALVEELKLFSSVSNLKLNVNKTKCLPIGEIPESLRCNTLGISFVEELKVLGITFDAKNHSITDKNIKPKIDAIRRDIVQWKRRNLTPIGKITVIKSLLLSKLVHVFISLPTPSPSTIKELEKMFHDFLWNNRSDPIKRSKLAQTISFDGLHVTDLVSFIKSMKIGWIQRLYFSNQAWSTLIKQNLPPIEQLYSYGNRMFKKVIRSIHNPFWIDVFNSWAEFIRLYEPSAEKLLSSQLWYSDFTKFKTTKISSWDEKGLRFIGDLIDPRTGRPYSHTEMRSIYNIQMTFLCYESLIHGLPRNAKHYQTPLYFARPTLPYQLELVSRNVKTNKLAYQEFVMALRKNYESSQEIWLNKWRRDGIPTPYVGSMYTICAVTRNSYLQSFHFKILSRIVATNRYLLTIGLSESAQCSFCQEAVETLEHLFWACQHSQSFIQNIRTELHSRYHVEYQLQKADWFLPSLENCTKIEVLISTIAKVIISRARLKNRKPSVVEFINYLRSEAMKEEIVARKKDKISEFRETWGNVAQVLYLT